MAGQAEWLIYVTKLANEHCHKRLQNEVEFPLHFIRNNTAIVNAYLRQELEAFTELNPDKFSSCLGRRPCLEMCQVIEAPDNEGVLSMNALFYHHWRSVLSKQA